MNSVLSLSSFAAVACGAMLAWCTVDANVDRRATDPTPPASLRALNQQPVQSDSGDADPDDVSIESTTAPNTSPQSARQPGTWASLEQMHAHYTHAFVESEGNGISRMVTFDEPHQRRLYVNGIPYAVRGMNLVGLTNDPVVYKASWVGVQRKHLESYETRDLTEFEATALEHLQRNKPYVWRPSANTPPTTDAGHAAFPQQQMDQGTLVAALTATESCVGCHDAQPNQVLGAFVYRLAPIPELSKTDRSTLEHLAAKINENAALPNARNQQQGDHK